MDGNLTTAAIPLFGTGPLTQLIVSSVNLILITFTLYISVNIDKKDVCRLFTIWLCLAHVPNDGVQIIISSLQLADLIDSSGLLYLKQPTKNIIPMTGKLFQHFASMLYRTLGLLMVFMTYTSYKYPMAFQELFGIRRRNKIFLGGLIFVTMMTVISNTLTLIPFYTSDETAARFRPLYYCLQSVNIGTVLLFLVLYVMSIHAIRQHVRRNHRRGDSTLIHRRQLVSIIVYAAAPNLTMIPMLFTNTLYIILVNVEELALGSSYPLLNHLMQVMTTIGQYLSYHYLNEDSLCALSYCSSGRSSGSSREMDFVREDECAAVGRIKAAYTIGQHAWLGGFKLANSTQYLWNDGTAWNFTNWHDDSLSDVGRDCVATWYSGHEVWGKYDCAGAGIPSICKKKLDLKINKTEIIDVADLRA
ncbi:hypothetical protein QR680_019333 [Steinernema hermaphroditum]|uniref:C-type lectin domain-containing protein n=1 Tax=Steinernema hermaphroditum TaxID=289476 RepID=A0AA39LAS8_9BILA|nr:hypothetical protein QR680_019333 [Steinernema hermaphroditum]